MRAAALAAARAASLGLEEVDSARSFLIFETTSSMVLVEGMWRSPGLLPLEVEGLKCLAHSSWEETSIEACIVSTPNRTKKKAPERLGCLARAWRDNLSGVSGGCWTRLQSC